MWINIQDTKPPIYVVGEEFIYYHYYLISFSHSLTQLAVPQHLMSAINLPIISINRLDFIGAPLPLLDALKRHRVPELSFEEFRRYIGRPLGPNEMECMISILMKPADIDPTCINIDTSVQSNAPFLKLSNDGKMNASITVHGDPQCLAVLKSIMCTYHNRIMRTLDYKDQVLTRIADLNATLQEIETDLEEFEAEREYFSMCGIIAYDAGSYPFHYHFHSIS